MNKYFKYAKHYYDLGLNVTCITGLGTKFFDLNKIIEFNEYQEFKNTKEQSRLRFKTTTYDFAHLFNNRQSENELNSLDWENAHGIGVILGFQDLSVVDVDGVSSRPAFCKLKNILLKQLGLGEQYEWVVETGSGFHIYYRDSSSMKENIDLRPPLVYEPKRSFEYAFKRVELGVYGKHCILPCSTHPTGKRYQFMNRELPTALPNWLNTQHVIKSLAVVCDFKKVPLYHNSSWWYYYRDNKYSYYKKEIGFYLFLDTETNGVYNSENPQSEIEIFQICWKIFTIDFTLLKERVALFNIDKELKEDVIKLTGISKYDLEHSKDDVHEVVSDLMNDLAYTSKVIGHNIEYDLNVLWSTIVHKNIKYFIFLPDYSYELDLDRLDTFCTMKETTELLKIPSHYGFKYPTLIELYEFLYGERPSSSHNAEDDVGITIMCVQKLLDERYFTEKLLERNF